MAPLGIVLSPHGYVPGSFPYEISAQTVGGRQLCPQDPYQFQRGEYGFYSDTPFGEIPTDFEKATAYQYTPVTAGWISTNRGYYPGHWMPPDGGATWWGPPVAPVSAATPAQPVGLADAADDVVQILAEHQRKQFMLSLLSTTAIVASSLITMYRTYRLIQEERRKSHAAAF